MRLAFALVVLVGCAPMKPFTPVAMASAKSTDDLYASAVRVLGDEGATVATNDRAAGVVTSEWEEQSGLGDDKVRHRWRVTIGDGDVQVASDCQSYTAVGFGSKWEPCGAQNGDRQARAQAIAERIAK